ncbi:hypothetical protein MMC18_003518 [Xylographa bjoerkii]|nr:hypothetical protein [Xylographa bjoerkii]
MLKIDLDGVALVVGAGGGLGQECAYSLAQAGAKVIVFADINEEAAQAAAEISKKHASNPEYRPLVYKVDVTDADSVQNMMAFTSKECGRVDYAVNSAGIENLSYAPMADSSVEDYDKVMDVNAKGTMLCVRAQLKAMLSQHSRSYTSRTGERDIGRGAIVNIASAMAHAAVPGRMAYTTSKHAVLGITKAAAIEYAAQGIHVNAVCPTWVWTKLVQDEVKKDPTALRMVEAVVPLKRMAEAEEVADVVAFLCSPSASYINGTSLMIDAGATLTYRAIPNFDLLSWIFENVDNFLEKPIYIDAHNPTSILTARDVLTLVRKLVAGFQARGIGPGDNICVLSYNHILYSALYLGIVGVGACLVGANPAYTDLELRHILTISKVKAIISQPELLEQLLPAATSCGIALSAILIFDSDGQQPPADLQSWRTLLEHGERDWISFDDEVRACATTATLLATSGTTGLPKAAAISHHSHVAQNILLYDSVHKPYEVRRLFSLPQFHAFAMPLVHFAPLREGHTTWVMKRYRAEQFLEYVSTHRITETAMVPPMVRDLVAQAPAAKEGLESLRYVWCAGAPLSAKLQAQMSTLLHSDAIFSQVWGMSEIGWITTFHYPERDVSGSVGRLLPNMEARIIDENGNEVVGERERGEILVRGPSLMSGYLAHSAATQDAMEGGWLKTGDIGLCEEGKWYILDRAKEIIKVKGWQVSPTELEACLMMHPGVLDAAVIGVKLQQEEGEVPRAYIVPQAAYRGILTENEIEKHFQGRLAKFKALAGGVIFIDSIPKGSSGKILRKLLRDKATANVEAATNLFAKTS